MGKCGLNRFAPRNSVFRVERKSSVEMGSRPFPPYETRPSTMGGARAEHIRRYTPHPRLVAQS